MAYKITESESVEVLSLADAKLHLRVQHTLEDTLIESYITEAIDYVETLAEKFINIRTIESYFKKYNSNGLCLDFDLVASIESVEYIALTTTNSAYTLLPDTLYHEDTINYPATVFLKTDETFPELSDEPNPIKVTYKAGYGITQLPPKYLSAIKYLIAQKYQNRQNHISRYRDIVLQILVAELDYQTY